GMRADLLVEGYQGGPDEGHRRPADEAHSHEEHPDRQQDPSHGRDCIRTAGGSSPHMRKTDVYTRESARTPRSDGKGSPYHPGGARGGPEGAPRPHDGQPARDRG